MICDAYSGGCPSPVPTTTTAPPPPPPGPPRLPDTGITVGTLLLLAVLLAVLGYAFVRIAKVVNR